MADTWQAISGYASNNYSDTMVFEVDGATKKLQKISGQTLIAGEKNSQYIRFMMPRYWDGIDVSEKTISIIYGLAGQYYGETAAISAERTDDSLRFGWVVPEEACCIAGTLLFVLVIKDSTYVLKSQITEVPVLKSINLDDVIPEPTKETWYRDFQVRVEQTLSAAENAVEEAQSTLEQARSLIGSPLVANTAAEMTDTSRIYVYTGSETGYTNGHWYYHNGSVWTDGGVYNAVAVDTDTTLTIAGKPADSKKTGDEISQIKEDFTGKLLSMSEMFKFYGEFIPYYITTSGGTIGMATRNHERYSGIVNLSKSIYLTMTNPLYVFRIYWYEGTTLHSTSWGDTWEIPSGVDVGITIKHRNSSVLTDAERPQYYLVDTKLYTEPKSYYDAEIADTVEKVNAAITEPSLVFLLSADPHTMSVQGTLVKQDSITDMVVNMKRVAKEIQFDGHISLGDIADFKVPTSTVAANYGITDLSMDNLDDVFTHWMIYAMEQLKSVPADLIYVLGNHDDNRYINRDNLHEAVSAYDYTKGEMYAYYIAKGTHNRVGNNYNNGLDYYIDYTEHKVRLIVIDSNIYNDTTKSWWYGYDDSTVTWLTDALNNMPTGYGALLLTHLSPVRSHNEDTSAYTNRDNIANVIQTFVSGGGNYIATLYGHSHVDWASTSPWLEICFAAAKCQNLTPPSNMSGAVAPTRTAGTYTEDCWSVVVVQPISRKIKIIRFGAGDDREYTY